MPYNCSVLGIDFVGPIIFAGVDGEDFCDFPCSFQDFKYLFDHLWEEE